MVSAPPLGWSERVALWDAVTRRVRERLRSSGCKEVSTPVRVRAPAIEPFIEPIAAPPGYLITSPELAMKQLLCRGSGSIFQISHCFRRAEVGAHHREEFHLVEWYRLGATLEDVMADVEQLVHDVADVVGEWRPPRLRVDRFHTAHFLDVFADTTGVHLRGDESPLALRRALAGVEALKGWDRGLPLDDTVDDAASADATRPRAAAQRLQAWTQLYTAWDDSAFRDWLTTAGAGVHLRSFPAVLAALARTNFRPATANVPARAWAERFESHVCGVELANGYEELADAEEQRERFDVVNAMRSHLGLVPLPLDEDFLGDLQRYTLPRCSGVALGLDRLIMVAAGASKLDDVSPFPGSS